MSLTKVSYSMIEHGDANVWDFLTDAQKADVSSYSFSVDVTVALQSALDTAWANKQNLFIPAGGYLVTGLIIPGNYTVTDERDKFIRIYGQGYGIPFANTNTAGTVIKSVTDAPVIKDNNTTAPNANGGLEIDNIRFDGTSNNYAVVSLDSLYGTSSFHHNVIYQRGDGDGFNLSYGATCHIHDNYCYNSDYVATGLGSSRTGIGFNFVNTYGAGLVTFTKNTSRGFLTGYVLNAINGAIYSPTIEQCECSLNYNGILLYSVNKAVIDSNYFEGLEGGTAINNTGSNYTTISNNLIFSGALYGILDNYTTVGTVITGNTVSLGNVENAYGISATSSASFGGYDKIITGNSINATEGTSGQIGLRIDGTQPRIMYFGNAFSPKGSWAAGSGATKISLAGTSAPFALITQEDNNYEFLTLSQGAIALHLHSSALTESNVGANVLTVPDGSYFTVTATTPTTINRFVTGAISGKLITFRTTNANMTFADSAYNQLAGGVSFTGPGTITFLIEASGGSNYGYEIARTVF